jgi:two-component sensor histidine kinase
VKKDELLLTWKEHGGPSLDGPAEHEGFGSSLVRRLGSSEVSFPTTGNPKA